MSTHDDLIRENELLRARLTLAEWWMQREVQSSIAHIGRESTRQNTRKHFANVFEQEGIDIITRKVMSEFGTLQNAPKHTLERLIDAEIYWYTLQKYPTMDGLPIILSYQKILDAWIEEKLIQDFRMYHGKKWIHPEKIYKDSSLMAGLLPSSQWQKQGVLARDIENIITKKYTLSIGRLYQILSLIRDGNISSPMVRELVDFWKKHIPKTFNMLICDEFFLPFSQLMEREIFSKKRHEGKLSFSETKHTKELIYQMFLEILN